MNARSDGFQFELIQTPWVARRVDPVITDSQLAVWPEIEVVTSSDLLDDRCTIGVNINQNVDGPDCRQGIFGEKTEEINFDAGELAIQLTDDDAQAVSARVEQFLEMLRSFVEGFTTETAGSLLAALSAGGRRKRAAAA